MTDYWPRDLRRDACLACYEDKGIDRPAYQCRDHEEKRGLDQVQERLL